MNFTRYVSDHRPEVILGVLCFLSLASLASGTSSTIIHSAVSRAVSLTAYPFLYVRTEAEEAVSYSFDFVWNYNALREENELFRKLRADFQVMEARQEELRRENRRLRGMLNFARSEDRLTLKPARVIGSLRGMLTIDVGRVHGIEPRMGVITEDGVVGMITEVEDLTASVATLHHRDCSVAVMVYRNRVRAYDGVVKTSSDYNYVCKMGFIDIKNDVHPGDILVTNPESLFPPGLMVGKVSVVNNNGGALWRSADVEPAVDPYVLDEVFVITRYLPDEEYFTGSGRQDTYRSALSMAPELPDDRSIQERFAP